MANTTKALASTAENLVQFTANSSYPASRAYTDTTSTTYAQWTLSKKNSTSTMQFGGFDFSAIPAKATVTGVTIKFKGMVNSTSYVSSATVQARSGSTSKGSATDFRATSASVKTLSAGTWTRAELDGLNLYISARAANNNNSKYIRVYGMEVDVTWEEPVEPEHGDLYVQVGGVTRQVQTIYRKVGGSWVEIMPDDLDTSENYVMV